MLAEIDKDARAIAALQEENKALNLRMDQMQVMLDQWTIKINDFLKEEPLGLEETEPHEEIVFEPFNEIRGRKLYRVTRNFIAGRTLRLIRVFQCRGDYTFYALTDGILSRQWNDNSLNAHFKGDVMATVYCKGDHVQGSSCGIMNTYNPENQYTIFDLIEPL